MPVPGQQEHDRGGEQAQHQASAPAPVRVEMASSRQMSAADRPSPPIRSNRPPGSHVGGRDQRDHQRQGDHAEPAKAQTSTCQLGHRRDHR